MRVLYVSQYFPPEIGAGANRAGQLTRALVMAGMEVDVVAPVPSYPFGRVYPGYGGSRLSVDEEGALRVCRHPAPVAPQHRLRRRLLAYSLGAVSSLAASLAVSRSRPPDLVIATSPPLTVAAVGVLAAWVLHRPLLLDVRDLWPDALAAVGLASRRGLVYRALSRLERRLYRQAAFVVVPTTAAARIMLRDGRVDQRRLAVCCNGVAEEFMDPDRVARAAAEARRLRHRLGLEGVTVVGYAGNLGLAYDLGALLEVAEALRSLPVAFLIVGQGALGPRLEADIRGRGLTNVRLEPPVLDRDELLALYLAMDLVVVPLVAARLFEAAVPAKVLELAALGRPLVLMGCPEAVRILSSYPLKYVLEAGDRAGLIRLVRQLCDSPPATPEATEIAGVVRGLSWDSVTPAFVALAERAAEVRRPREREG